jgi:hypothetical protein
MLNAREDSRSSSLPPKAAWCAPYILAWIVYLSIELDAASSASGGHSTPIAWLLRADLDAIVYLVLLLVAPLVWWLGDGRFGGRLARRVAGAVSGGDEGPGRMARFRPVLYSILVATTSLGASIAAGSRFDKLPPAYHDEYSYLFQAETFLAGRVSYPSHEAARLFDQMHVVNEGRFASRYFPGTGVWMAPFVALGHPYWGHWLAGALCAVLMFWIGRDLAGDTAGLIAGLLTALSPGMALFSNLLLAHHPTLVGLGVFILGWLRTTRMTSIGWGFIAGAGLTFATLCRPMTAAGVALPFGVYTVWWAWRGGLSCGAAVSAAPAQASSVASDAPQAGRLHHNPVQAADQSSSNRGHRLRALAALTAPLLAGAVGLFAYDRAITGSGWTTPYSLYTDIYTPWHVYGFNNVTRGEQQLGPRVIENYNRWAENLTPSLAATNAVTRLSASWKWSLGLLPLTLALGAGLILFRQLPREAWLILAAITSLHAVHVPYWFVGMEDHHYVFESGPLWALWTGVVTVVACRVWRSIGHGAMCWWWAAVLVAAIALNYTVSGGTWSAPLEQGIGRVAFARKKHGQFADLVAREARPLPALVLVDPDPSDRHIDYVTNAPDLRGPVLIGRYLPDIVPLEEVKRLFPDRSLFLYRVREKDWQRLE